MGCFAYADFHKQDCLRTESATWRMTGGRPEGNMQPSKKADMKHPSSSHISRRDFIMAVTVTVGAVIGAAVGLPGIGYLISPALRAQDAETWILLGLFEKIPIGIPTYFSFNRRQMNGWENTVTNYGVFAVRKDETNVIVLSNICTHLGCHVTWHPDIKEYVSPCHNGHFDINGKVTFGPPPRPLDEYQTKVEDGNLSILFPPYRRS
jgi:menaquinol-cytochrome c reductase iron-sulfur subunit